MEPSVRQAVKRLLAVCEALWQLPSDRYRELMAVTDALEMPSRSDALVKAAQELGVEASSMEAQRLADDTVLEELKRRYAAAAEEIGLDSRYGLAMLEYATILMDLEEEDAQD